MRYNQHSTATWSEPGLVIELPLDELTERLRPVMEDGEPQIRPGHCFMIANYILLLRHLGYNADYENIRSGYGFVARVRINGIRHAIWQGGITQTDHSVLEVEQPLSKFGTKDHGSGVEA